MSNFSKFFGIDKSKGSFAIVLVLALVLMLTTPTSTLALDGAPPTDATQIALVGGVAAVGIVGALLASIFNRHHDDTPPSSSKAIISYSINGSTGIINESNKTIAVTVPYGTTVTSLVATFSTTGSYVKVGSIIQTSGFTPNDFTRSVTYTVVAGDNTTIDYTITVTVANSSAKAITTYSIGSSVGTINEANKTIAVTVPSGTTVTSLVATFSTTGSYVKVGSVIQTSGSTTNDFTSPVIYTVVAGDNTTIDYTITVTVAHSSAKAIISYSINGSTGIINESNKTIAVTVPFGTNVTSLIATFITTGSYVKVGSVIQTSGFTSNNFTRSVTYTVVAGDDTTADYTVTVTVAHSSAKAITTYSIGSSNGTIDEGNKTIAVTVPFGSDVTGLIATFSTTGSYVKVGSIIQTSGFTPNNFTNPVTYTVTADDTTTGNYTTTVTVDTTPKVGDSYGGGVIITVDTTNSTLLIMANTDQDMHTDWANSSATTFALDGCYSKMGNCTGYETNEIGSGKNNTNKIISTMGIGNASAAEECANYTGGGYTDWYLPSAWELNEMRKYLGAIVATYWSSTEYAGSNVNAWFHNFGNNYVNYVYKTFNLLRVRAVRNMSY